MKNEFIYNISGVNDINKVIKLTCYLINERENWFYKLKSKKKACNYYIY